ncbi:MAG: type II toxin-antitoxin system HicB family antitoxin [Terriglobales bacterium]
MKYAVIYEKSATGYGAYVPDLAGCVATGKTRKETERRIREAIELYIESLRKRGDPVPLATTVAEYINISAD